MPQPPMAVKAMAVKAMQEIPGQARELERQCCEGNSGDPGSSPGIVRH